MLGKGKTGLPLAAKLDKGREGLGGWLKRRGAWVLTLRILLLGREMRGFILAEN